jgi:hypothetical protein
MMKKQSRKPGQLPKPVEVKFPESEFSRFFKARMVELDRIKREHEDKWGVNRIIALVDVEFRVKVWKQAERVWEASGTEDFNRLASACDGMIRAYRAMDQWATAEGIAPAGEVKAIEWEMPDGAVMAVVSTEADAAAYQKTRPDVQDRHIWSMAELATMLASGLGSDIARLKATIGVPATVVKVDTSGSGFDDFENDLDLDQPSTTPKMFPTDMKPLKKIA